MARKINPLSVLSALDKFIGSIPDGFTVTGLDQSARGAQIRLTASADAVRAAFPSARNNPGYSVGEVRVEGSAEIFDGERRLSLEASATETVPTVERILSRWVDTDLYNLGVWTVEGNRRLWTLKAYTETRVFVRVSDIAALRELGVTVEEIDLALRYTGSSDPENV